MRSPVSSELPCRPFGAVSAALPTVGPQISLFNVFLVHPSFFEYFVHAWQARNYVEFNAIKCSLLIILQA